MTNCKEQFDKDVRSITDSALEEWAAGKTNIFLMDMMVQRMNTLTSEIIEKLIADIPDVPKIDNYLYDSINDERYASLKTFKQQLRDKWLNH